MKNKGSLFLLMATAGLLFHAVYVSGQPLVPAAATDTSSYPYWIRMMQDPDANFFSTVSAFEKYWAGRQITKGCGWKVFKRWEYLMRGRITPDGRKPLQDEAAQEWKKFSNSNRSSMGTWTSLGPGVIPQPGPAGYLGLGRLNEVAFHPTDPDKLYVGAPSGGMWMSDDHGNTWSTTTDQLPTIGVSSIIVDYVNPQIIYIGTGDRDHGDAPGMGVYRSTDGGNTWGVRNNGMGNVTVGKLIQHPSNAAIMLAATSGGVFRTTNGGSSWTLSVTGNFVDIVFKPGDPNIVYATADANFYRSLNNGTSFSQITSGLTAAQRGAIAVSAASPGWVYFLQSDSSSGFKGVYRSEDSGLNFTARSASPNILDWSCDGSGTGGQGWYDLVIVADPINADIVYVGGVNVWKSVDGASSWSINSHWYGGCSVPAVHADCHFLGFSPLNNRLYAGNDGGIYFTADGGTTWTDRTVGMTIGQIYKLGQSRTDAAKVINGFQDNGTYTVMSTGWHATGGGDGMECAVDAQNSSITYHTIYFGSIFRKINNSGEVQIAGDGVNGINESGDWVTPFILAENDPVRMFVGYKNVWRCPDATAATPVWTAISTGETTGCMVLEQSPANPGILYVVRWNSMKRTENANDAAPVWVSCTLPGGNTPTDLEAHPTDPSILYATAGNKVYKSINKGNSWTIVPGSLPNIPVNTIVYDTASSEGLYIGTQTGVLYRNSTMSSWVIFSSGLPVVDVRELEIYYDSYSANNRLVACTYGRGLWRSDLYYPPGSPPLSNFSFSPAMPCSGGTASFTDLSLNSPASWTWSFNPGTVTYLNGTHSHSPNPVVAFQGASHYQVTLTVSNANGTSQHTATVPIGGNMEPLSETFEAGQFSSGWTIENSDGEITWNIVSAGGNGPGTKAAMMEFYNYYPGSGQIDGMVLPPVNLSNALHPVLTFKVAYRRWGGENSDGLKIFLSTDCGTSWDPVPLYDKSGLILATLPDSPDFFVPGQSSDWRTDSLDLGAYKGMSLKIKFEGVNGWGNNLYIDDISIADVRDITLSNQTVTSGSAFCFDARHAIHVAGGGTWFRVNPEGSATLLAGSLIGMHDGTTVSYGGYLLAAIRPSGPYCEQPLPVAGTNPIAVINPMADTEEKHPDFKIVPNPSQGTCRIIRASDPKDREGKVHVFLFDLRGRLVFPELDVDRFPFTLDLEALEPGVYIVRVKSGSNTYALRLILLNR